MEPSVALCVGYQSITIIILLAATLNIVIRGLYEVIFIYKVIPRVVRRINVDHFHLAKIIFTQQFQDIKIVAFYIQILCLIKIHTIFTAWTESFIYWCVSSEN